MKILGMELYPTRKTDDEYIEQVRRGIQLQRRLVAVHLFLVILWGILLVIGFRWFLGVVRDFELADVSDGVAIGLAFGLMLGLGGCYCFASVISGLQCLLGDRRAKLLVKFYDELMRRGHDES